MNYPSARFSPLLSRLRRRWKGITLIALTAGLVVPLACDRHVTSAAEARCHTDLDQIVERPVALLLGTAREFNGYRNAFYTRRIEAAATLYHSGKICGILASGDNGRSDYDEPGDMRADLMAAGVPAEFITLDYAGFRTRDSILRAKKVFGQNDFIIVSQRFHAERALYIARQEGIEASAFIAADPASRVSNTRVRVREILARTIAVSDHLTGRQPRFLGKRELVALRE
ncbi:MAG: SanA/YdcF family protein [Verrucomicrobiales bacterium]